MLYLYNSEIGHLGCLDFDCSCKHPYVKMVYSPIPPDLNKSTLQQSNELVVIGSDLFAARVAMVTTEQVDSKDVLLLLLLFFDGFWTLTVLFLW